MEYSVRVAKSRQKPVSVMRFNGALGVDPAQWTSLKMAREDHSKHHKTPLIQQDDNMRKFGAGYGRRRKSGGGNKRKFNVEEQPWIMKTSEKNKKYRGVKEGGVSQNASYYIFTQAADGAFEVLPVTHWYNFTPTQRYKSLTAEEAEEQFGRRNKIHNYFSVMVRKRLKADDDNDDAGKSSKKASSGLKVSEMDDWDESESEEDSDKEGQKKESRKKKRGEAEEDSEDVDEEGRELDYISDTSDTDSEEEKEKTNAEVGVDQEQEILDSESDEEGEKPKDDSLEDEEGEKITDGS